MTKKNKKIISYEKAMLELQEIVQAFQEEVVSIDQISEKVKRSAELIKYCQEKLRSTEKDVNELLGEG